MTYFNLEGSGLAYTDQYCYPQSYLAETVNLSYTLYLDVPWETRLPLLFNSILITVIVIFTDNIKSNISNILNTL